MPIPSPVPHTLAPVTLRAAKRRRLTMLAAFQPPVLIWLVAPYLLATQVFALDTWSALAVAAGCGYVVFMIECVMIVTPLHWATVIVRLMLTALMSAVGALAFDIVLFRGDIESRMRDDAVAAMQREQTLVIHRKEAVVLQSKADWEDAQRRQNAEADGTGGSKSRGCGVICNRLSQQANERRALLTQAQDDLKAYQTRAERDVAALRESDEAFAKAGVLHRLAALHAFMQDHPHTLIAWAGLFVALMLIESSVLYAKLASGRPLEERLDKLGESAVFEMAQRQQQARRTPDAPFSWRPGRATGQGTELVRSHSRRSASGPT